MPTLYVRNLPADLYADLQRWAAGHDRSINGEVIDLIQRESVRRQEAREFARRLAAYREKYADQPIESNAAAMIREDRDRGHTPEFGY